MKDTEKRMQTTPKEYPWFTVRHFFKDFDKKAFLLTDGAIQISFARLKGYGVFYQNEADSRLAPKLGEVFVPILVECFVLIRWGIGFPAETL